MREHLNDKFDCLYNGIVSSHEGSTASFSMCENAIVSIEFQYQKK